MKSLNPTEQPIRLWIHGLMGRMGTAITKVIEEENRDKNLPVPSAQKGGSVGGRPFQLLGGSTREQLFEVLNMGKPVNVKTLGHVLSQDHPEVILDFTSNEGNKLLLETLTKFDSIKTSLVIGTTGLDAATAQGWHKMGTKRSILFAPNTSLGILQMLRAARHIACALSENGFDVEIIETHHKHKKDSPSGTALFLANSLGQLLDQKTSLNPRGAREDHKIGVHGIRGGMVVGEHEIRFLGPDQELTIKHRAFDRAVFARGALRLASWICRQSPGVYHLEDVMI